MRDVSNKGPTSSLLPVDRGAGSPNHSDCGSERRQCETERTTHPSKYSYKYRRRIKKKRLKLLMKITRLSLLSFDLIVNVALLSSH